MMNAVSKSILALAAAAAMIGSGSASAATNFNPFTVSAPGNYNFVADKITGNYTEIATFNPDGSFSVSLYWKAGQFVNNSATSASHAYDSDESGLGMAYGVYGLYQATGVVTQNGSVTTFNAAPGSGYLQIYLDGKNPTTVATAPGNGTQAFTLTNNSDDKLLATGVPVSGQGNLDPTLSTCQGGGINCGSFGSTTTFVLTADGSNFFVSPVPFYDLSFQSGQLDNFTPTGTQTITGSLDLSFRNAVPEPATVGLLGLGLLGLGFARRRKQ